MKTTKMTTDLNCKVSRDIQSPYADAKYAFGRVKVTYVEYIKADDAFASNGPWPITAAYSAHLVEPSPLAEGKASWDMICGSGDTAVEATRDLLDQIDDTLRNTPLSVWEESGN